MMKPLFSAKTFPAAALVALLVAPISSHANPALDACIDAFVKSTLPKDQPVRIRKKNPASPLDSYEMTRQVAIVARVSRTGARVAQATCTVDRNDEVIALNSESPKPRIAAALEKTVVR